MMKSGESAGQVCKTSTLLVSRCPAVAIYEDFGTTMPSSCVCTRWTYTLLTLMTSKNGGNKHLIKNMLCETLMRCHSSSVAGMKCL